jgi:LCP family protein required for cell wall assembly
MTTHSRNRTKDSGPAQPPAASGVSPASGGGRAAARKQRKRGGRRALKIIAWTTGALMLLGAGGATYAYVKLNGNIAASDLYAGTGGDAGREKPDAFGRTPINILMIGSDVRGNAADCKLGGACDDAAGQRADVEMVVHISADRSNATVMSIPRDLRTDLKGCDDKQNGTSVGPQPNAMINSALNWGPGCSVAAVHHLTGITIDHFMMVDFSGVVNMSEAIGGVGVCVDKNVYDPYSHLKLSKGPHTLKGESALQFLRTRHGFGVGTDTGRTVSQHMFLTSMINSLKSAGTLSNPKKVWSLAQAATKSLTVDHGLQSIQQLIGLADDVNKVPTDRITFATMQTQGEDMLTIAPGAKSLFKTIADDQSLTTAKGKGKKPAAPAAPAKSGTAVDVENGTGVTGRAGVIAGVLTDHGFSRKTTSGNGAPADTTTLTYPAADKERAKTVASALGLPSSALKERGGSGAAGGTGGTGGTGLVLLIGADWESGNSFPNSKVAPDPADTQQALDNASSQNGKDTGECAPVSTFGTVGETYDGKVTTSSDAPRGMTPTKAYALSPGVKNSAP